MKSKLWTKDYIISILTMMMCHMGPYLLLSVISIFAKNVTGSDAYAGMMASVFALSGLFARFISAGMLEKMSCKKVMQISVALLVGACLAYVFIDSYWPAFILRGIQGLGYGIAITAMSTYVVNIVEKEHMLEAIGYSSLTNSLGGVIGPTMAYAILGAKYDRFQLLFIVVFVFELLTFISLFLFKDVDLKNEKKEVKENQKKIQWKFIFIPTIVYFITNLAMSSVSSFLSLYAIDSNIGGIATYFSVNAIGLFLSRFTMKPIVNKLGDTKSIFLCAIVNMACLVGISLSTSLWQLLVISFPFGYSMGVIAPVINSYIIDNLPMSKSGLGNAIFYASADLGFIFGATFWGYISGLFNYSTMYFIAGLVSVVAIILTLFQFVVTGKDCKNELTSIS